jgi:hypothetical protein
MSLEGRATNDIVRIAAAGGGIRLKAGGRTTNELVEVAAAASRGGARLFLCGLDGRTTDELVMIAAAGKGAVVFDNDPS